MLLTANVLRPVCGHSFPFGFKPLLKIQQEPLATAKSAIVLRRAYRLKLVILLDHVHRPAAALLDNLID